MDRDLVNHFNQFFVAEQALIPKEEPQEEQEEPQDQQEAPQDQQQRDHPRRSKRLRLLYQSTNSTSSSSRVNPGPNNVLDQVIGSNATVNRRNGLSSSSRKPKQRKAVARKVAVPMKSTQLKNGTKKRKK